LQLLGLDFLVDTSLHPWLLEVNGTPSLAVDHADPATAALIHTQKVGLGADPVGVSMGRSRGWL
jgi:tubulin polyglutamylase TTLL6/13